jgi:hypothetical protein
MVRPSILIRPDDGAASPEMSVSRLDLPQPLGPTRVTNSPRSIVRSTAESATTGVTLPGNSLRTASIRST